MYKCCWLVKSSYTRGANWYLCVCVWQLIRNRYPSKERRLFDDVLGISSHPRWPSQIYCKSTSSLMFRIAHLLLYVIIQFPAIFVLHHPEHGHAVILPIISCIIDGTLEYDRSSPPFASFISLVCPSSEVRKHQHKFIWSI